MQQVHGKALGVAALLAGALAGPLPAAPTQARLIDPLEVRLALTAPPDAAGRFEATLVLDAHFHLAGVRVSLVALPGVELEEVPIPETLDLAPGERVRHRVRGRVRGPGGIVPPGLSLSVEYPFPFEELLAFTAAQVVDRSSLETHRRAARLATREVGPSHVLRYLPLPRHGLPPHMDRRLD